MIIDTDRIPPEFAGSTIKCMCHLAETGESRAGQLAGVTGLTTAAITGMIDRLLAQGLVHRHHCPRDRRAILVSLTDHGVAQVNSMRPGEEVAP
jgi:DNA-binding MarR family transcriptional regulator